MSELFKISIKLLTQSQEPFVGEIYIKIGEAKAIKVTHDDPDFLDILTKYERKGLKEVYVDKKTFEDFLRRIKAKIASKKLFDPLTIPPDQRILELNNCYELLREQLTKIGFSKQSIEMAQDIALNTVASINEIPNLARFFNEFKEQCNHAFIKNMLIGYVCSTMIEFFPWRSAAIKTKCTLATLLCDVFLEPGDFIILESDYEKETLPENILQHGDKVSKLLSDRKFTKVVSKEMLNIIEQHHERPNGTGFPRGLNHQQITILTAINIVANHLVDLMIKYNFDFSKRQEIYQQLEKTYHNQGVFQKALSSVEQMICWSV